MRYLFLHIIYLSFLSTLSYANIPKLRVLLGKNLPSVLISGVDLNRKLILNNNKRQHQGHKTIKFNCHPKIYSLTKQKKSNSEKQLLAEIDSPTGVLTWEGDKYRGKMLITKAISARNCNLINELSLEKYLNSLLAKEMNGNWPLEALKAQAVAARSYAYLKLKLNKNKQLSIYDIENSEKNQVSGGLFDETPLTSKAVKQSWGQVLINPSGELVPIFYHSKCGGQTILPENVWYNQIEGYTSVDCPFCEGHGTGNWSKLLDLKRLENVVRRKFIRLKGSLKENLMMAPDRLKNRFLRIYYGDEVKVVKKSYVRQFLGRSTIPSNYFTLKKNKDGKIIIKGSGNGHGVGMCQFGALDMAQRGMNYKQILHHYFPFFKIRRMY